MSTRPPVPDWFRSANVHCHTPRPDAIVCVTPWGTLDGADHFSVGIHPWEADKADSDTWQRLETMAADSRVAAIGECGLDKLRGPAPDVQMAVFRRQAELAERLGLPLIIHMVGCWDRLLALKREMRPTVPWNCHAFRVNPGLACQPAVRGFSLSLGRRFNPDVPAAVPADAILRETDD